MPPRYVKPYVKRGKNDAADAEAICEAVRQPTMRFIEIKTLEQQSVLMLHRTRQPFVRQRTTLIDSLRAHLAAFGIVAGVGRNGHAPRRAGETLPEIIRIAWRIIRSYRTARAYATKPHPIPAAAYGGPE